MATKKKATKKKATKKTLPEGWVEYDGKTFSSQRKVESYRHKQAVARGEA